MPESFLSPQVIAVCTSPGGIPKWPHPSVKITFAGLEHDGHNHAKHQTPFQAVSLQDIETLNDLAREGFNLIPGATGENLTLRNVSVNTLSIGTILEFSNGVVLELTKVRKPCYVLDAIDPLLKEKILGRCGFYAKVLREGAIAIGEAIRVISQE